MNDNRLKPHPKLSSQGMGHQQQKQEQQSSMKSISSSPKQQR
jgi:hypothetical protein